MPFRRFTVIILCVLLISCLGSNKTSEHLGQKNNRPKPRLLSENVRKRKDIENSYFSIYCGYTHNHFIDIEGRVKIDSLINIGVDTIMYYRNWLGTNSFNGYGEIIWLEDSVNKSTYLHLQTQKYSYQITTKDSTASRINDAMTFYFNKRLDTVRTSPRNPEFSMSHDSNHFIYVCINKVENCFDVSGLNLLEEPNHLKSQLINKLTISPDELSNIIEPLRHRRFKQ